MNLFTHIANLITSVVRPEKTAFTTVIYPSQGKAVVVHDGLRIRHENRWHRFDSLLEEDEPSTSFSTLHDNHTSQAEPVEPVEPFQADSFTSDFFASSFEPMGADWVNPANGMPMMDSCFDVMGNAYGMDTMSDSLSFDHGMSDFGGSFSAFGFD
ncbi:hypothetical protein PSCT_00878 [Pseudomonas sp. SCT]|uniref:hypothetical protein n=1 Tax=Pseudomonas sp. (strain SCT) TaxID=412955 RepID=UPI000EDC8A93|nr:hypothetical protein [Pseudomonas sp. SCT]MCO4022459.1 hypothetical protein [Pseudomonas aeruginosa]GCA54706.1 hypothetical protein PSCT_00878 [Pseudomonas sp. SCT]